MNSLYLAHPYDWMAHYGIPNMKWGVRRFQNKDGSLTEAGKKRYAKAARGHMRSEEGDVRGFLKEGVSRGLSPMERVRLKASYNKLLGDLGDADNANAKLKSIANEKAQKKFEEEVANNPDRYNGVFNAAARKVLRELVSKEAVKSSREENPDLVTRINAGSDAVKAWKGVCRDVTDRLVGEYGDKKVRMFSSKTVGDVLSDTLEKITIEEWYD